jgi:hypothetical protein
MSWEKDTLAFYTKHGRPWCAQVVDVGASSSASGTDRDGAKGCSASSATLATSSPMASAVGASPTTACSQ